MKAQLIEQKQIIENKKIELESMAQLFDIKKENLVTKFNQTNMIKEVKRDIYIFFLFS